MSENVQEQVARHNIEWVDDWHRPQYHFMPPANWLNDPNGLIYWQGQYHLFYQYNSKAPIWGNIEWGHAASQDLVHWQDWPIALSPTPGTADADGCWSGVIVNNNDTPTLIYTGWRNRTQLPCLATSDDGLLTWQKYQGNPIITAPPPELEVSGFRDHCIWQEAGVWYQIIGTGFKAGGGAVLLYSSPDLIHWQYEHIFAAGDPGLDRDIWECPDFFRLGDTYVLLISSTAFQQSWYYLGDYVHHKFVPYSQGRLDAGGCMYAPQTILDKQGRRLLWGWLREERAIEAQKTAGWSGAMTVPLELSIQSGQGGKRLNLNPIRELEALRYDHCQFKDLTIAGVSFQKLADVGGECLEIVAEFEAGQLDEYGLVLRCALNASEYTRIVYNSDQKTLTIDRSHSSLDSAAQSTTPSVTLEVADHENLRLHVLLDSSIIEIFANQGIYLSSRLYPTHPQSLGVGLFTNSSHVRLKQLDVWKISSIWPPVQRI